MDIASMMSAGDVPQSPMSMGGVIGIVVSSCVVGLIWAAWNYLMVRKVQVGYGSTGAYESVEDGNG